MAPFNPQTQFIGTPNYTNITKPISDVPADKSKALAIATATDALDSGVQVAERIDQDVIKEKTRAGVEALRDATTAAYDTTRTALMQGQTPDPAAANVAGLSLMKKTVEVPEALQGGLDRAEDLATARAQGTMKANDTLYTGALNSLAKQLRSEYPGHKDFIDEQIARISGKNPANAYMDNLLQDVRNLAVGGDATQKKVLSKAFENMGDPSVAIAIRGYQAGLPGAYDKLFAATQAAEKAKLDHQIIVQQDQEDQIAGKVDIGKARFQGQQVAANTVYRNFNSIIATSGLDTKTINTLINESRTGKITTMSPDNWESLAQHLEASRDMVRDNIKQTFNNTGLSGRFARQGEDENKIIDNEMQFYDRAIAAIRDPNKGTFFELQRRAKGLQDNANYQALSGPMGDFLMKSKITQDHLGSLWMNHVDQLGLQKGYLGRMGDWYNDTTRAAAVPDDVRKDGVANSLTYNIKQAKQAQARGINFDPRLYDDLVKNVDLINDAANNIGKDPKAHDIATQLVKYMFDPQRNKDFVNQWSRDFTDANGVQHKGYFAYYDMMSSPKVTESIRRLGDAGAWDQYKNWQSTNFRQLFGNETQALNNIQTNKANPATIHWDPDNQKMYLSFANKPTSSVDANYQRWAQDSVSKLNNGLRNMGYMYKLEGTDPNEGIFSTLMQMNFRPREGFEGRNLPKMVTDAINQSQFQPSPEERLRGSFQRLQKPGD